MKDTIRLTAYPGVEWHRNNLYLTNESRLWRHVLNRAILDAASRNDELRLEVGHWLLSDDFSIVCHYAACDEDILWEKIREILLSRRAVAWVLARKLRVMVLYDDPDLSDDDISE